MLLKETVIDCGGNPDHVTLGLGLGLGLGLRPGGGRDVPATVGVLPVTTLRYQRPWQRYAPRLDHVSTYCMVLLDFFVGERVAH